ncbi:MAG: acyl carrier protein [Candidatus Aenigmarchaeota archaeon]|nr:acyl carrier protein [Candidatus Aenigmarchaeota archaeon]
MYFCRKTGGEYNEKSLKEAMREIICERLEVGPEEILPNSSMIDDLGADSLDTVELTMAYEEELDIEISDEHEPEYIAKTFDIGFAYLANRLAEEKRYEGKLPKMPGSSEDRKDIIMG